MYFTKVELYNFGIYKGAHEMCLTDRKGGRNITLVGGLNGRGKTTFHDAILIALYGRQAHKYIQEKTRSYEKLLLDHINKHAADGETYVAVSLCLDDGTRLRVKRAWSEKNGRAIQQISVEKNGVEDKYLGDNWEYYIEEILPFGIARFFFFNNEKITQLADDASFEQIKSSIKSAIGVSTIEMAIQHANTVIQRKQSALEAFENSEANQACREADAQIVETDRQLAEATRLARQQERRYEDLEAAVEAKEKDFWSSGGNLSRNRDAIEAEKRQIAADVEALQNEIMQLTIDASTPLFLCRDLVVQSYNRQVESQKSEALRYSGQLIDGLYQKIMDRLSQSGLDSAAARIVEDIVRDVLARPGGKASEQQPAGSLSAASMMLYEHMISKVFQSIEQHVHTLVEHVNAQESELLSLDAYLEDADDKTLAMRLYEALKETETERDMTKAELDRQLAHIKALESQRETLTARRIKLIKTIAEKENANDDNARVITYAAMSIQVLTEFKMRLQREKVAALADTATHCFQALVEKDTLVSGIAIHPETLDVSILDPDGRELLKSQLSAGEQQMFAVAIVWALALTSGYKAPVIIDTPMARLDSSHRANFVTKYLPAASSQVMVLSTDEEIYGRYLDLVRDHVVDCYTLLYQEKEQCTSIVHGYFGEA